VNELERRAGEILDRAEANTKDPERDARVDARRRELAKLSNVALAGRAAGVLEPAELNVLLTARVASLPAIQTRSRVISKLAHAEVDRERTDRQERLAALGQRAIDWWLDTGTCFFCAANASTGAQHEHCTVGEIAAEDDAR
jgi:cytidylate kinase